MRIPLSRKWSPKDPCREGVSAADNGISGPFAQPPHLKSKKLISIFPPPRGRVRAGVNRLYGKPFEEHLTCIAAAAK